MISSSPSWGLNMNLRASYRISEKSYRFLSQLNSISGTKGICGVSYEGMNKLLIRG